MPYDHIRIMNTVFESGVWGKLTASAIKTYTAICKHYNWERRRSNPSIKKIAQECGISKRSVNYAIEELIKEGLIIKKKEENSLGYPFNSYIVVDYLLKELENLSRDTKIPLAQRIALANAINCLIPETYFTAKRKGLHTNYIVNNYINITNSFNQTSPKIKKEKSNVFNEEQNNDFQNKLRLYNLKLGNYKRLNEEEIESILPQLNRDTNLNEEEKESIKIGLRTGIIGRSH